MENQAQNFWGRKGFVKIEDESRKMVSYGGPLCNGLDIKFKVEKLTGDAVVAFEVGVLGLSSDTINHLTVWNPQESFDRMRRIEIYAGYEKDGLSSPIASGYVIQAYPTNPPEMWMNFFCLNLINLKNPIKGVAEMVGKTRKEIFAKAAEVLKLTPDWGASKGDDKVAKFAFDCNIMSLIDKIKDEFDILVTADNGKLTARDKRGYTEKPPKNVPIVDLEHGLLALGNVTLSGATIKTRLSDMAQLFSWIYMKSVIVPKANGYYYVVRKAHVGQLRGQDWYTELQLMRYRST